MKLFEMEGFLRGKCLPGDMKVNETNAEYLVRKFTDLELKLADSQREFRAADETIENLQMQVEKLAAENAGLKAGASCLVSEYMMNKGTDSEFIACITPSKKTIGTGGIWDMWRHLEMVLGKTPATDAFLAEVRASAIPEGYVLVPQEMHLSSEAMEGICFHCGDGGFAFGEFTDGLLFVGAIDDSDGQKIHGLHIATADYPEEGCATICAFLPAPTEGAAQ